MSLAIDVDTVGEVLLADGWHTVLDDSFFIDSYEFVWSGMDGVEVKAMPLRDTGDPRQPLLLTSGGAGYRFLEPAARSGFVWTYGPVTAILAVRRRSEGRS